MSWCSTRRTSPVSDQAGQFVIRGVPAGTYTLSRLASRRRDHRQQRGRRRRHAVERAVAMTATRLARSLMCSAIALACTANGASRNRCRRRPRSRSADRRTARPAPRRKSGSSAPADPTGGSFSKAPGALVRSGEPATPTRSVPPIPTTVASGRWSCTSRSCAVSATARRSSASVPAAIARRSAFPSRERPRVSRIPARAPDSLRLELGAVEHLHGSRRGRHRRPSVVHGRDQPRRAVGRGRRAAPARLHRSRSRAGLREVGGLRRQLHQQLRRRHRPVGVRTPLLVRRRRPLDARWRSVPRRMGHRRIRRRVDDRGGYIDVIAHHAPSDG